MGRSIRARIAALKKLLEVEDDVMQQPYGRWYLTHRQKFARYMPMWRRTDRDKPPLSVSDVSLADVCDLLCSGEAKEIPHVGCGVILQHLDTFLLHGIITQDFYDDCISLYDIQP